MNDPGILCIGDTGGIAPEDLPRIFEKGYTGYNGHSDKKASGIGLYAAGASAAIFPTAFLRSPHWGAAPCA